MGASQPKNTGSQTRRTPRAGQVGVEVTQDQKTPTTGLGAGAEKKQTVIQEQKARAGHVPDDGWFCVSCTVINERARTICAVCSATRESSRAPRSPRATGHWICPRCTCENVLARTICQACDCPLADDEEKKAIELCVLFDEQVPVVAEFVECIRKKNDASIARVFRNFSLSHKTWLSMSVLEFVPLDALRGEGLQFVLELTNRFKNGILEGFLANLLRDLLQKPAYVLDLILVFASVAGERQRKNVVYQQEGWLWETAISVSAMPPLDCVKNLVLDERPQLKEQLYQPNAASLQVPENIEMCDRLIEYFGKQIQEIPALSERIDYDKLVVELFQLAHTPSFGAPASLIATRIPTTTTSSVSPTSTTTTTSSATTSSISASSPLLLSPGFRSAVNFFSTQPIPSSSASSASSSATTTTSSVASTTTSTTSTTSLTSDLSASPIHQTLFFLANQILNTMKRTRHRPIAQLMQRAWEQGIPGTESALLHPRLSRQEIVRRLHSELALYDFVWESADRYWSETFFGYLFRCVVDCGDWALVKRVASTWGKNQRVCARRLIQALILHRLGGEAFFSSVCASEYSNVPTQRVDGILCNAHKGVLLRAGTQWPENLNEATLPPYPLVFRRVTANITYIDTEGYEEQMSKFCQAAAACGLYGDPSLMRNLMLPYQLDTYLSQYPTCDIQTTSWSVTKCMLTWLGAPDSFRCVLNPDNLLGLTQLRPPALFKDETQLDKLAIQHVCKQLMLCFEFYVEEFLEFLAVFPPSLCHIVQDYLGNQQARRLRRGTFCGPLRRSPPGAPPPSVPGASSLVFAFWVDRELVQPPPTLEYVG